MVTTRQGRLDREDGILLLIMPKYKQKRYLTLVEYKVSSDDSDETRKHF